MPAGLTVKIALAPPASAPGAELKPAPIVADSTVTDKFGSYKLTVKEEGKCILTLVYEKQAAHARGLLLQGRDALRPDPREEGRQAVPAKEVSGR